MHLPVHPAATEPASGCTHGQWQQHIPTQGKIPVPWILLHQGCQVHLHPFPSGCWSWRQCRVPLHLLAGWVLLTLSIFFLALSLPRTVGILAWTDRMSAMVLLQACDWPWKACRKMQGWGLPLPCSAQGVNELKLCLSSTLCLSCPSVPALTFS